MSNMASRIGVYPNVPLANCLMLGIGRNYYVEDAFREFPPSFNKENGHIDYEKEKMD